MIEIFRSFFFVLSLDTVACFSPSCISESIFAPICIGLKEQKPVQTFALYNVVKGKTIK